jgi:4-oxalocrotonate tautomerase
MQEVLGKEPKTTFVIIEEVENENWGVGGELVLEV